MPRFIDLTGRKSWMLTVVSQAPNLGSKVRWNCLCDCGKSAIVAARHIQNGAQKSCGCLHTPHGMTNTPEFRAWTAMTSRCTTPSAGNYHRYGAKGVTVCERWKEFTNFHADMGPHPGKGYSLDRIDGSGNYEPTNCRWATATQQIRNRKATILTAETVQNIRALKSQGVRVEDLASMHGVSMSAIYKTLQNRRWATL